MRFENMEKENVNGNIHFNFAANGNGSMVVEGYTDSAAGWLYLQRYVKFSYTSQRISATERHYRIKKMGIQRLIHRRIAECHLRLLHARDVRQPRWPVPQRAEA